jgi:acyl-coenzyme A synthetase/AMP-(fatty) acid ligase
VKFGNLVENLESSRILWVHGDRSITAGELRSFCEHVYRRFSGNEPVRVALELSSPIDALLWMVALDGVAEAVFLVPESLVQSDDYTVLKERSGCTQSITQRDAEKVLAIPEQSSELPASGPPDVPTRWILATSGTTGVPKLIEHSTVGLTRTCKVDPDRGREYVWGLVYEPFRFAGLQVVLQALSSGSRLIICHDAPSIAEQASVLRENAVNALSATPTYWRKLLMSGETRGHMFKQITLGGEMADQSVLNALSAAFPQARIAHIYASTEAGVGFSVNDGKAGFPIHYLDDGIGDVGLKVSSDGALLVRPGMTAPSEASGSSLAAQDGYIDTGDLVEIEGDRVYFLGRASGAINVGGNKVVPEEVEAVIRSVEGAAEVLVRPKQSGVMGQLVSAEVVPTSPDLDKKALRKRILEECRNRLERHKVPALIRFVEHIDYGPTGKLNRT